MNIENIKFNHDNGDFTEVEMHDGLLTINQLKAIEEMVNHLYDIGVKNIIFVRE